MIPIFERLTLRRHARASTVLEDGEGRSGPGSGAGRARAPCEDGGKPATLRLASQVVAAEPRWRPRERKSKARKKTGRARVVWRVARGAWRAMPQSWKESDDISARYCPAHASAAATRSHVASHCPPSSWATCEREQNSVTEALARIDRGPSIFSKTRMHVSASKQCDHPCFISEYTAWVPSSGKFNF